MVLGPTNFPAPVLVLLGLSQHSDHPFFCAFFWPVSIQVFCQSTHKILGTSLLSLFLEFRHQSTLDPPLFFRAIYLQLSNLIMAGHHYSHLPKLFPLFQLLLCLTPALFRLHWLMRWIQWLKFTLIMLRYLCLFLSVYVSCSLLN